MKKLGLSITLAALLPVASFAHSGCKSNDDASQNVGKTVEPANEATSEESKEEGFQRSRNEFVDDMQQTLTQLDDEIANMNSRVESMGKDAKAQMQEGLDDLKDRRERVKSALERGKDASSAEWNEFKQGVQADMNVLSSKYNALLDKMKTGEQTPAQP